MDFLTLLGNVFVIAFALVFFGSIVYCLFGLGMVYCRNPSCDFSIREYGLKWLESRLDVRTIIDNGGTDPYVYEEEVRVFKCPKCGREL